MAPRTGIASIVLLVFSSLAAAQDPPLEFEVATIRTAGPLPPVEERAQATPEEGPIYFDYNRAALVSLIRIAYGMDVAQIRIPDKLKDLRFDIRAKAPKPVTRQESNIMLQSLLRDRLHLVFHRETQESKVWVLNVAKGGIKMLDSSLRKPEDPRASPLPEQRDGGPLWLDPGKWAVKSYTRTEDKVTLAAGRRVQLSEVAALLQQSLRRTGNTQRLVDETGLTGTYDFGIEFVNPFYENQPETANPKNVPGIFTAVEQYLGLRITEAKRFIEILVVDKADSAPPEN